MSSNIGGTKREQLPEFVKRVGLFGASVIAINPNEEEYKELLGIDLKEDSKALEYLGESKDGNTYLRIAVWLRETKSGDIFPSPLTFFLENKERQNKELTKKQYINNVGVCSWADDPNNLPDWFVKREYRVANAGEEELYDFLRTWLGELDYRNAETVLQLDWKKLMKGNVKDLREQIGGEWCTDFGALATVIVKEKDGEIKEYQGVYNKAFLPAYTLKHFRLVDYSDPEIVNKLKAKKPKDQKSHEKFVLKISDGEFGCKDAYILSDLKEYNADDFLVSSDKVISEDGPGY